MANTLKFYNNNIKKVDKQAQKALYQTTEWLHTEVANANVVPFDTGNLQQSLYVEQSPDKEKCTLVTNAFSTNQTTGRTNGYAQRLYWHPEYNFDKRNNANARGEWYKDWLPGGAKNHEVIATFKALLSSIRRSGS